MSAGSNLQGGGGLTLEQRVANIEAALRGGPPVIDAQGANTHQSTDLGGPMNAWRRVYAELLSLGGVDFSPTNLTRNLNAMRAEYDYVWNGIHPDDLDSNAVIWLDGTTTGDHDVAAMVPDDVVDFRLLLLTSGRDSTNWNIAGTNAQRSFPTLIGDSGSFNDHDGIPRIYDRVLNSVYSEPIGSWVELLNTPGAGWNVPMSGVASNYSGLYDNDIVTRPGPPWRQFSRSVGDSLVVHLGDEGPRGSSGPTHSRITVDGTTVWEVARIGSSTTQGNRNPDTINGACLLVPIYPV